MKPKTKTEPETPTEAELDELFNQPLNDVFDCVQASLAFEFRKHGAAHLRKCLYPDGVPENLRRKLIENGLPCDYDRESLTDWADELRSLGLTKAADVLMKVAAIKHSRFEDAVYWGETDNAYWRWNAGRKRREWEAKRQQRLSQRN